MSTICLLILHWGHFTLFIIPTLFILFVSALIWIVNHSYHTKFVNNDNNELTLPQILQSLQNFVTIGEYIFPPDNYIPVDLQICLLRAIAFTPIYIYIIKNVLSIKIYLLLSFIGVFIWYTPLFVAARSIFWRWKIIRSTWWLLNPLLTKYNNYNNSYYNDGDAVENLARVTHMFNAQIRRVDSQTQIIEFEIQENQRRWILFGWTKLLLITDNRNCFSAFDAHYQFRNLEDVNKIIEGMVSSILWLDEKWEGQERSWLYMDNNWKLTLQRECQFTRTRNLKRKALFTINT